MCLQDHHIARPAGASLAGGRERFKCKFSDSKLKSISVILKKKKKKVEEEDDFSLSAPKRNTNIVSLYHMEKNTQHKRSVLHTDSAFLVWEKKA